MKRLENKIGEKFKTNEGQIIEIIEFFGVRNCTVRFEDGTILKNREYKDLQKGNVKNPYYKSVCGVGYIGEDLSLNFTSRSRRNAYLLWKNMLFRCYDERAWVTHPGYEDCFVVDEWHNFQNFAKWLVENDGPDYDIDKDILTKGNKIYGPDTCCMVPHKINSLFLSNKYRRGEYPIGVSKNGKNFMATINRNGKRVSLSTFNTISKAFKCYKTAKESHIKEIAEKYKDQLSPKVYNALINYEVQITD